MTPQRRGSGGHGGLSLKKRFVLPAAGTPCPLVILTGIPTESFRRVPSVKQWLWGGEFWTDGYYIATVSGRGDKKVIEEYIKNQGRQDDVKQLRLFDL